MTRIVINDTYGGFSLSEKGTDRYAELKGLTLYKEEGTFGISYYFIEPKEYHKLHEECKKKNSYKKIRGLQFCNMRIERDDPALIQVVEELGRESWGECAKLKIVEIPDGVEWEIEDHDGNEWVSERHRTWG